jgi:5-methyltetrahydropteroyltriglutamate--homocysteine methyltransferase
MLLCLSQATRPRTAAQVVHRFYRDLKRNRNVAGMAAPRFALITSGACCARSYCAKPSDRHAANEIGDDEFERIQDGCIRAVVHMQEEIGLEVATDGEFRRGSYWGRFVERTDGLEISGDSARATQISRRSRRRN